jgi:hypothetical protein
VGLVSWVVSFSGGVRFKKECFVVGFVLLDYADVDFVWDVQEWVFLDRFNFPDEQSEDHHDQAVSFFKVRVVKEQINLPYSCARRTTGCAVEADISRFLSKAAETGGIALLQKSSDQ